MLTITDHDSGKCLPVHHGAGDGLVAYKPLSMGRKVADKDYETIAPSLYPQSKICGPAPSSTPLGRCSPLSQNAALAMLIHTQHDIAASGNEAIKYAIRSLHV